MEWQQGTLSSKFGTVLQSEHLRAQNTPNVIDKPDEDGMKHALVPKTAPRGGNAAQSSSTSPFPW